MKTGVGSLLLLAVLVGLGSAGAAGQEREPDTRGGAVRIDRVVAVVDDDPILYSDIEQALALGGVKAKPDESREELERRALDALIEHRVRWHEIDRYGFAELRAEEVEAQVDALRGTFESEAAFQARLRGVGLDERALRQLLARQLLVAGYVEERLGARVFVGLDDIREHYDEELVPTLEASGEPVPPLEEVREAIRETLRQERLNTEIERWTEELRLRADVLDFLDHEPAEWPPVLARDTGR